MLDRGTKAQVWISKPEASRQDRQAHVPERYLVFPSRSHHFVSEGFVMASWSLRQYGVMRSAKFDLGSLLLSSGRVIWKRTVPQWQAPFKTPSSSGAATPGAGLGSSAVLDEPPDSTFGAESLTQTDIPPSPVSATLRCLKYDSESGHAAGSGSPTGDSTMAPVVTSQSHSLCADTAMSLAARIVERNKWHPHVAQKYRVDPGEGEYDTSPSNELGTPIGAYDVHRRPVTYRQVSQWQSAQSELPWALLPSSLRNTC